MGQMISLLLAPMLARFVSWLRTPVGQAPLASGLTALDGVLAVVLGLVVAPICTIWLAPFTIPGTRALGSPDFGEYCAHVSLYAFDAMHEWGRNRSKLAGLPAGLLTSGFGILDSLLLSATGSLAVVVGSVYLWGRAIHGRAAGIAGAILLGAVGPLATLGRMLTFYPVITACLALASAGAACAVRWRSTGAIALAGIGAGLALLVDTRGLLWALPAVGMTGFAVVVGPARRWWGIHWRALALLLPLLASWEAARWAYTPTSRTLEGAVAIYDELKVYGVHVDAPRPDVSPHRKFLWGYTDPRNIPYTLQHLQRESSYIPDSFRRRSEVQAGWQRSGAPWVAPVLGALAIAVVGLRRRPLLLLALLGSSLPFVVSMQGAVVMKTSNLRFIASAMVFIPVVLGVGMGVLVDGSLQSRGPARDAPGKPIVLAALAALLLGMVQGVPQTWLAPQASWRMSYPDSEASFRRVARMLSGEGTSDSMSDQMCAAAITHMESDGVLVGALPGGGTPIQAFRREK